MDHWFEEAETYAAPGVVKCLVGSKLDKVAARAVTEGEGRGLAERYGASFFEVSAKKGDNTKLPFVDTVDKIVDRPELMQAKLTARQGDAVTIGGGDSGGLLSACAC